MNQSESTPINLQRQLTEVKNILSTVVGFQKAANFAIQQLKLSQEEWYYYLPVAAVNTSFCIELLLKALHQCNSNSIYKHDLQMLFENLPKHDRVAVDNRLKTKRYPNPIYASCGYTYLTVYQNQPITIDPNDFPKKISDVFKFHKDTFVRFRYLFEQAPKLEKYRFEADILLDLIDVLTIYTNEKIIQYSNL